MRYEYQMWENEYYSLYNFQVKKLNIFYRLILSQLTNSAAVHN